jgi:alpha,alpha-trehalase
VATFLRARGISLPWGQPGDEPGWETVCSLGNRKDAYFQRLVDRDGVQVFQSTVQLLNALRRAGLATGVFTASRSAGGHRPRPRRGCAT